MVSLDAGAKYRGFELAGEYYWRVIDDLQVRGSIPYDDFYDHGFQLLGSYMVLPKKLQAYTTYSRIYGEFGDPWDLGVGVNYFFSGKSGFERQLRLNVEYLYLSDSPVGNFAVPYVVGGNGGVIHASLEFFF